MTKKELKDFLPEAKPEELDALEELYSDCKWESRLELLKRERERRGGQ